MKRDGAWVTTTGREVGAAVREVALGLIALGRQKGDAVAAGGGGAEKNELS